MPEPSFDRILDKILVNNYYMSGFTIAEAAKWSKKSQSFIRTAIGEMPFGDVHLRMTQQVRIERYEKLFLRDNGYPNRTYARATLPADDPLYMDTPDVEAFNDANTPDEVNAQIAAEEAAE